LKLDEDGFAVLVDAAGINEELPAVPEEAADAPVPPGPSNLLSAGNDPCVNIVDNEGLPPAFRLAIGGGMYELIDSAVDAVSFQSIPVPVILGVEGIRF